MNVLEHYHKDKLHLSDPYSIDDDTFFCKFSYDNMPFMVKTNKICYLKGSNKNTNNYINVSLTSQEYLIWFETFYKECIQLFYEKSSDWFEDPMSMSDIEFSFINPLKSKIQDNCFDIQCMTDDNRLNVVDSNENVHKLDNVTDSKVIPTFHIRGVKFNSKYFMFEIELINLYMILDIPIEKEVNVEKEVIVNDKHNVTENKTENENENENENVLNEFELPTDNLEESKIDLADNSFYKIYELINNKIKENLVEHLRDIFIQKKIKKEIDLTEMIDDEDN